LLDLLIAVSRIMQASISVSLEIVIVLP